MSVSLGAKGAIAYWSSGTIDVPYPAGVEAGDLLVLQIGFKEAIGAIRQPRGWSEVAEVFTTFGTVGPDTGPSRISTFVKRALGNESGFQDINLASANASWAQITRWISSTGEFYVETVVGQNAVDNAIFSAELTPISRIPLGWLRPGDVVMAGATANTDTVNWSAHSISSPGLTFGAVTELDEYATTSGNNLGGATWYAHVMSGAQTDRKVTVGATLSANAYGAATLIRIRDSLVMDPDAPTLVGVAAGRNSGSKTIQVGIPIGVKAGDLLLYSFMGSGSEANIAFSDDVAKGWTVIHERVSGTRYNQILGRIYDPATPITDYLLTSAVSVSFGWTGSAWRNHDLTTMGDLIVGTGYNRGSTINYTTVPGITLPKANSVALAFFGEATNALGGWTQTANDFDLLIDKPEQPVSAASIEWVTALYKKFPLGGETNPVTLTYVNAIVNAFGIQVGFARGAEVVSEVPEDPPGPFEYYKGTLYALTTGISTAQDITLDYPAEVLTDDVLIAQFTFITNVEIVSPTPDGWTLIRARTEGSRRTNVFAKTRLSTDVEMSQTFNISGSASVMGRIYALRNVVLDNYVAGPGNSRATSGGGTQTTALSVTTTDQYRLVLAIAGEATTASDALGSITIGNGFTTIDAIGNGSAYPENGTDNSIVMGYKLIDSPGSVGDTPVNYPNPHGTNGYAFLLTLKRVPGESTPNPISTGLIGLHALIGPSSDQVKIGAERLSGNPTDVVVAELWYEGVSKLSEQTMDGDADWLHANFQDVAPDSLWVVKFRVNDVVQTDVQLTGRTLPSWMTPTSFVAVTGSCQVTGSNHMIFDKMAADNPLFFAHMGDLHYKDASDFSEWRAGMESSMKAPRFAALLEKTFFHWSMDNHDRVITNPGGDPALGLNLGATDPRTVTEWRKLAGNQEWATEDTLGRTWVVGRVRFIQTDMWSKRDDPDFVASPRTFLGAAQKQWWKDVMGSATEPLIVWFTQWTGRNNATGRWASFPEETAELEAFVDARPGLKRRMVLIGGDSHSLQADSGTHNALRNASSSYRWRGIPSLNVSGIDKNGGTTGDAGAAGQWDIANAGLRTAEEPANGWGAYSRMTFTDDGLHLRFKWEAVRMDYSGNTSVLAWFERSFGNTMDQVFMGYQQAVEVYQGTDKIWEATEFGASF